MRPLKAETARTLTAATILVAALLVGAKLAEDIVAPTVLAVLMGLVAAPLMHRATRLGLPRGASAGLAVLVTIAALGTLGVLLEPVVVRLIEEVPRLWTEISVQIEIWRAKLRGLGDVSDQITEAIGGNAGGEAEDLPSATDALLFAPVFAAQLLVFLGTLFFFLLGKDELYAWLARRDRTGTPFVATERLLMAERAVSQYVLTICAINCAFGCVVAAAMWGIGVPFPAIWGLAAALMNFILYLGPFLIAVALAVAGQLVFSGPQALLPPLVFASLNLVEGYFATPLIVSRSLSLSPLLVFVTLTFWLWLWGPIGGVIALPLTIWLLVVFQQIDFPDASTEPEIAVAAAGE